MPVEANDAQAPGSTQTGVYVYGILPGDVEVEAGTAGVGDPPAEVRVIQHGDLAALVSDIDPAQPLGSPEDLVAHEELLDAVAAEVPVLPLRFGAVVASDDAVAEELLAAHHDEFAATLAQLEGRVEYVVKGRYVEDVILNEVLEEDPRAARLRDQIKDGDPEATRALRMELGEIINTAVTAKREEDTRALGHAVAGHVEASVVRPPTQERDAGSAALLVETAVAEQLERALRDLASDWDGRVDLRLIGPLAAYDFVGAPAPASDTAAAGG